jgi:hypothetical protein
MQKLPKGDNSYVATLLQEERVEDEEDSISFGISTILYTLCIKIEG